MAPHGESWKMNRRGWERNNRMFREERREEFRGNVRQSMKDE